MIRREDVEDDMNIYQRLSAEKKVEIKTAKAKLTSSFRANDGNFRIRCEQLLQKLSDLSIFINDPLQNLKDYIKRQDSDKALVEKHLEALKKDSNYILKRSREAVIDRYTSRLKAVDVQIIQARLNRNAQERRELVALFEALTIEKNDFRRRYVIPFEKQGVKIQNFLLQLQPEIIAGAQQENGQQNQLRRRRGRTRRARRARNNNILQNAVVQKVPSPKQTFFFTFFKIKRSRQQGNMREPKLFDNKVDNDDEIVRKAVIVKDVDGGLKVGTIVYESMDQLQGGDVDKVRIYYLMVNGIKNIKKENLKTIRDNDSNVFVKLVERDVITPIPENFDYDYLNMFSCINYAPSGAVIGYVPGQYRFLGATLIGITGYLFYLKSIVTNEAELRKLEDEINRQSVFVTGYLGVEQEEKLLMQQKKCQGINFANIFSREMILALAMTNPVNVEKWVKKNLKKNKNIVMTIMSIINFSYTSYTEKFLRIAFFGTTAMTTVVATNKYVGTIYALRNLLDYAVSEGINYTEKYISFVTTTLANLARDIKRLLPLQYILKYIFDLISKVIPNGTAIKFITQIFNKDFVVNSVTTRALLGFDIQILAEILNYIFFLQSMITLYTLMCPLLLWYSGQLENCAYQPRKKEKSELYEDLKF